MLVLTFSWGLSGVATKLSYPSFGPILLAFLRATLAAAIVVLWCQWRGIALFRRDGTLVAGIVVGLLFGIEFVLIFIGLEYTTVARSALLVNTMPFWVLVGAHFLLGERMTVGKVLGLLLAFAGVALVFSDRLSLPSADALFGDVLSLGAGLAWGATTLVIRRSNLTSVAPEKLLLYQLVVSAALMLAILPFTQGELREVSAVGVGALLFQSVYVVAMTYLAWFWLVGRYPAAALSSFAFLTPAFGVLMGGLLLDEPLSPRLFVALAMIAVGLVIVNRPRRLPRAG